MRIGHGSALLHVPDGTAMGGYAARDGASSGVLEPLQVDCIAFPGLRLLVAEILHVNEDLAAEVRRQVADAWVCATHTHAGPDVGADRTPAHWRRAVAGAASAAAGRALDDEEELAGRFHSGVLEGIGSVRGSDGEARVRVDVVSFLRPDGRLAGVLAVVPVHPTVLPATSTLVGGDLAGAIRTALRRELGASWVVVATGAAGDISTRRTRRAQTVEECRRLGAEAARQIAALMRTSSTPLWDAGPVASARRRIMLPARAQDAGELAALRAELEHDFAHARGATALARTLETSLQGIDVAAARAEQEDVPLVLSAARIGRLALFGIGAEPFHSLSGELPAPSVLLGYANGHAGYLPDAAAYDSTGYEVLASPLRRDAAATAVAALTELLPDQRRPA
jgi:hypothetical protein